MSTALSKNTMKSLPVGSRTDVGCVRDHNEDNLLIKAQLYAVADGMGGHVAGEIASEIAIQTLEQTLEQASIENLDSDALRNAVVEANTRIIHGALRGLGRRGMGTTLTAAIVQDDRLLVAQVGDSRAYLLHKGQLRQITRDHSLVSTLLLQGAISEEEARQHPERSVITRALGADPHVEPDLYEIYLHEGDRLLLCSDGLTTMLDKEQIEEILLQSLDPQDTADALVQAANTAGGFDNTTVIVVDITQVNAKKHLLQKKRFTLGIIAFLLVFVLLMGAAIGGMYLYAHNSAFLINQDGYVVVYRGLPGNFMGIELKWLEQTTTIKVQDLNPTTVSELQEGIRVDSLAQADSIIAEYETRQQGKR